MIRRNLTSIHAERDGSFSNALTSVASYLILELVEVLGASQALHERIRGIHSTKREISAIARFYGILQHAHPGSLREKAGRQGARPVRLDFLGAEAGGLGGRGIGSLDGRVIRCLFDEACICAKSAAGDVYPEMRRLCRTRSRGRGRGAMQGVIERLTERQTACLLLVAQGYTSKEIGRRLGISPTTVDNHVRSALSVLQVESRAEAARLLVQSRADAGGSPMGVAPAPPARANQPLTSQARELVPNPAAAARSTSTDEAEDARPTSVGTLLPPLGGHLHDLGWDQRLFAILRVAVFGIATLIVLTLAAAALLWAIR